MLTCDRKKAEQEIYAMAYAYAKSNKVEKPKTYIIRQKIREMKGC